MNYEDDDDEFAFNEMYTSHEDCENLRNFFGRTFDADVKTEIEAKFHPYTVHVCDECVYYHEDYWVNEIRCVVDDGKIKLMSFN